MSIRVRLTSSALAILICSTWAGGAVNMTAAAATSSPPPGIVTRAIDQMVTNPPLFNDRRAQLKISDASAVGIVQAINIADTPIYIAILPSDAGVAKTVTRQIQTGYGKPGTYVSVVGNQYDAISTFFAVQDLLGQAFREQRNTGTAAVLTRFVQLVGDRAHGIEPIRRSFAWLPALIVVGVGLTLASAYGLYQWSRRRTSDQR